MHLGVLDYVFLVISLGASVLIGIYHGVAGLNQTSVDYLLGSRLLKPIPLAMSLTVGTLSAITIMGNAGEMYAFGTQLWIMDLGIAAGMLFVAKYFLPIFYPLKMVSLYQYIECRFKSKFLRKCTVIVTLFGAYVFMGFLLYPPSLLLKSITGFGYAYNIIITGLVCSIYSSFGGVKAVVYTDVLQALVMILGAITMVVQGAKNVGGLDKALDIAYHHHRIEFFNFDLNPYQRNSFWLVFTYGFFFSLNTYGVNQSQTQRTFSTSSVKQSQRVIYYAIIGMFLLRGLANLSGVVIFANYADCDPLTKDSGPPRGEIQIVIFYVLEHMTKIAGLSGIFVASIYAAVLSSISTQVNAMTALVWEDFLKELKFFHTWQDQNVTRLQKVIVFITGVIGILMSFIVSQFTSFLKELLQITGAFGGPTIGLFLVAIYLPWVKDKGAILGFVLAISVSIWIVVGQIVTQPTAQYLPMSHEGCVTNVVLINETGANVDSPYTYQPTNSLTYNASTIHNMNRGVGFYGISHNLNHCWSVVTGILAAVIYTFFTGSNKTEDVDRSLIHSTAWNIFENGLIKSFKDILNSSVKKLNFFSRQTSQRSERSVHKGSKSSTTTTISFSTNLEHDHEKDHQITQEQLELMNSV